MRKLALFAALILLATPAAASGQASMEAAGAGGAGGLELDAARPTLIVSGAGDAAFELQSGGYTEMSWRDDYYRELREFQDGPPLGGLVHFGGEQRRYDNATASRGLDIQAVSGGKDSVLLAMPLASGASSVESAHRGSYLVSHVEDELLEHSHVMSPDGQGPVPSSRYYEYRAQDTLGIELAGEASHTVRGDFLLYLWSFTYSFNGEDVASGTHRTGNWSHPDPDNPVLQQQHYAFTVIEARDAVLRVTGEASAVYADRIAAVVAGETEYRDASGSVPSQDGDYAVGGDVLVRDGTAVWASTGNGTVSVAFLSPATRVAGAATHVPVAGGGGPAVGWIAATSAAAVLAGVWAAPHMFTRDSGARGFRAHRAEGFSRLAVAAEAAGRVRVAAVLSGRAVRWEPNNPTHWINRACFLGAWGRTSRALRCHERLQDMLEGTGEDALVACNAFEAARSAARVGDPSAQEWLRIAFDHDPSLGDTLDGDPLLAGLARQQRTAVWDDLVRP